MLFGIFFTFAIANSAASSSTIPDTNTSGLEAFIHRCLHGKVEGATLTVSGIDTNKHGIRNHVELTFYLNGSKGDCDIILRPPDQGRFVISDPDTPPDRKKDPVKDLVKRMKGLFSKKSGYHSIPLSASAEDPSIFISLLDQGVNQRWILYLFYPKDHFSGAFIKSFVAQAMAVHSRMRGNHQITLDLMDNSDIREQYWLEKGRGKTYYEDRWNLVCRCFLNTEPSMVLETPSKLQDTFTSADEISPQPVFSDLLNDPSFHEKTVRLVNDREHYFLPRFLDLLMSWFETNSKAFRMKTTREALDSFIPYWKSVVTSKTERKLFAQETFIFFFRKHPDFDLLQEQVLGLLNCGHMVGTPIDDRHVDLNIIFTENVFDPSNVVNAPSVQGQFEETVRLSTISHPFDIFLNLFFIVIFFYIFYMYIYRTSSNVSDYFAMEV